MRLAAALLPISLLWAACGTAGTAGTGGTGQQDSFELGKPLRLTPGASARATGTELRVGFDAVIADSRCPKGERCVSAGDATVRVWLQQGTGPRVTRELHTATGAAQTASALGHELRLLSLEPYPVTGRAITNDRWVATLVLNTGSAPAPER